MKSTLEHVFNNLPDTSGINDFKSKHFDEFIDELWKNTIWLSDISSSGKKTF
jgi:hypothetical protein